MNQRIITLILGVLYGAFPDWMELEEVRKKAGLNIKEKDRKEFFRAIAYLREKGFVNFDEDVMESNGDLFGKVRITGAGIDYYEKTRKGINIW